MVSRRQMALTFFWVGLTSYGGPAIVAQIRKVTVLQKGWLSEEEFQESLAFVQTVPGPVAVQTAGHVGWRLYGGAGAAIALVSYVLPAFLLMLGLSAAYFHYGDLPAVRAVFTGLGAVVAGIIMESILSMAQTALRDWRGVVLAGVAAAGFALGLNAVLVLLGSGLLGVLLMAGTKPPQLPPPQEGPPRARWRGAPVLALVGALAAGALVASGLLWPALPRLGAVMAKVDMLAFGGGYTAVALMYNQVVTVHPWLSAKEFIDGLALGQVTPGPVIMTATFIGYRVAGLPGALAATFFVFLPSALLLVFLAPHFARVRRWRVVQRIVRGLLAAFIAMLFFVLWQVMRASVSDGVTLALAAAALGALRLKVNPAWVILAAVVLSLALFR